MHRFLFPALSLAVALNGCAYVNPFIRDFNIISVPEEAQLGKQLSTSIAQEMPLAPSSETSRMVETLGQELVKALPDKSFDYHFYVVEDKTPNAFAIPGGHIYVHTGLIQMSTRNELAGVIAHEIGHVYERHPAKSISRAYGLSYLAELILKKGQESKIRQMALQLAGGSLLTKYGRDDEREADEIAYYLMQRAGKDPAGLVSFLKKIRQLEGGGQAPSFLSTHPPTAERIERLEALIARGDAPAWPVETGLARTAYPV